MPKPMLAESVRNANHADRLINDDEWFASQKVDGHRLVVDINPKRVRFLNRQGERYQQPVTAELKNLFGKNPMWGDSQWMFDGEYLPDDGVYWVFDMIQSPLLGEDASYEKRYELTEAIVAQVNKHSEAVRLLPVATSRGSKAALMVDVHRNGGEGVMFRKRNSLYHPGQRSRSLLKFKFVDTADVIVGALKPEGRRSVSMELNDGTQLGSVATSDRVLETLAPGDVIEVRYLYLGVNGKLYQPAFLRKRNDKAANECVTNQLKPTNKGVLA